MTVRLEVNINDETLRVIRWAEIERGYTPKQVLEIGIRVLTALQNASEVYLLDQDGNREPVSYIRPDIPPDFYQF